MPLKRLILACALLNGHFIDFQKQQSKPWDKSKHFEIRTKSAQDF